MSKQETIRRQVAEAYAKAVGEPDERSCCGGAEQRHIVTKLGGYSSEELQALPADAVINSFGCGNPVAFAEIRPGQVVLDLGSGAGIDILLAARKVGPGGRAIGIDMTDEMIARARENISASGLDNVEVRQSIIEKLPVESESVDWVISNCVINLSPEKEKVFVEIQRVLRPGGRMAVSDIVARDLPAWIRGDPDLYSGCIGGAISEEEYLAKLRDAGLIDVQVADRIIYDADQLAALLTSELSDAEDDEACACGCGTAGPEQARKIAEGLAGKIWSARFLARKPQAAP